MLFIKDNCFPTQIFPEYHIMKGNRPMKTKIMNIITLTSLLCLVLTAVSCNAAGGSDSENTKFPSTNAPENTPVTEGTTNPMPDAGGSDDGESGTHLSPNPENPEIGTDLPVYPGDIEIELPELQETAKIILSVKNGKVLGASSLDKPVDSDIIDSYDDFQKLYGTVEGIDETFFDTHVLRLVHTAQSSGSTRYAVESVTLEDGKLKVEIIEQLAAISTRDLRHWFVFVAVERAYAETPVDVHVTGIQLTE